VQAKSSASTIITAETSLKSQIAGQCCKRPTVTPSQILE
jgi:hypothetical protein